MYLKTKSAYLTGLTHMASSCSKEIGPSYIVADCFDSKNFIKDFASIYEISEDSIKLEESTNTLEEMFQIWLGKSDLKLIDGLMHWIKFSVGKPQKVYELSEESNIRDILGWSDGGLAPFYILDDLFFVECEKCSIAFLIGNDE